MSRVAGTVADVYRYTSPEPLLAPEDVRDWYEELEEVRGDHFLRRLEMGLHRAWGANPYRAFLMGHSGCGKSTELARLCDRVAGRFAPLRLLASAELDPGAFEPFDLLLVTLEEVIGRTALPKEKGGADTQISAAKLHRIREWLGRVEVLRTTEASLAAGAELGVGLSSDSLLAKVMGMFAAVRGEAKFAANRKKEVSEYQLSRLSDLIDLANDVLDEANRAMIRATGKEWLILWEDLDKPGFAEDRIQRLFLDYGHIWSSLRCNLVATIPISLAYSDSAAKLPLRAEQRFVVPDPTAFTRDHAADPAGRAKLLALLHRRVAPKVFAPDQDLALVVASGGNLRDLMSLVNRAADTALIRDETPACRITAPDVEDARRWLRTEYLRRLGESPYEAEPVPFAAKVRRLLAVYKRAPDAEVPDRVLAALLRTHAVQEFNHERWLGVHPLVVDILQDQGHLKGRRPPGGTRAEMAPRPAAPQ